MFLGMPGATPESSRITAQLRLCYVRVASPIELVFFWMNQIGGRTMSLQARFLRNGTK